MRVPILVRGFVVLAVFLGLPAVVFGQASITGTVKDSSGAVLPGVTVEASSPVLIEKVRTAITDGTGQYRVVDLRPGSYAIKFTLVGFKTFERSGIELNGTFTALVNADLSVGALEETVIVSGVAPIVNVQSANKEVNLTKDVIDAIPTSRMTHTLAVLQPGVSTTLVGGVQFMPGTQDVGGDRGGTAVSLSVHGSRGSDTLTRISGNALTVGGTATTPMNMAGIQEVTVDTSAMSAEEPIGGVRVNLIPRDGGNTFAGSFFGSYVNEHLQSDNFSEELKARGLAAPNRIKANNDINPGFGGPLSRDRLWFFASARYLAVDRYASGLPFNRNAYLAWDDPQGFVYAPDPSLGVPTTQNKWFDGGARLTWQVTPKNKLAVAYSDQYSLNQNSWSGNLYITNGFIVSPEASLKNYRPKYAVTTVDWTSSLTSRLLIENHFFFWQFEGGFYPNDNPKQDPRVIEVDDTVTGINYRNWNNNGNSNLGPQRDVRWRTGVTYATGAHQFQVGFQFSNANNRGQTNPWNSYIYTFSGGAPVRITMTADPIRNWSNKDADLGLYAGDKWTVGRLTLSGAARFDYLKSSFPDTPQLPGVLFPSRVNVVVPGGPNVSWKDMTWRSSAVHDVFGNGKTAVRVSLNRYLGLSNGLSNPNAFVTRAFRSWTDANRNFVPDGCDLLAPAASGECGALSNPLFGQVVPGTNVDPALRDGWGKRFYNWEFTTGVQREIASGVSVDVGYFRRWYGNFTVSTNLAVGPADYDTFSITAPVNPLLPNTGATVSGLVNLKPTSFGRPSNTFVTLADNYGNQTEHYNGVDVNVTARLKSVQMSGGFSTGRASTDFCDLAAARPDVQVDAAGIMTPLQYCHVDPVLITQVKGFASYAMPVTAIQVSAAFQSLPGPPIVATYTATNADAAPSLGRPLTGGSTLNVNIIPPVQYFGDHLYQLDLRFARAFKAGTAKFTPSFDLFNVLNGNAVQQEIAQYGSFRRPLVINQARFVKFSLNVTF